MRYKILFLSFLFLILPAVTNAQIPFGGKILASYECTCSGGWLIYFWDNTTHLPIPMTFQFGASRLNANFNIFKPLTSILGSAVPGGVCSIGSASCFTVPSVMTVTPYPFPGIGTSAI